MLEAGAVGDQLSIKAWKVGEAEPSEPQWTYEDHSSLPRGRLGVMTWHWAVQQTPPGIVDVTYDDICYTPPLPGDFNADGVLDIRDINSLSDEVRRGNHRPRFNLNDDTWVDQTDLDIWVHDLKNTWFGDANLDGEFNSSDMTQIFDKGKYETEEDADWAEGDWNGDDIFDSGDVVTAFVDGGYEKGPPTDAATVPEPASVLLLVTGLIAVAVCRRQRSVVNCGRVV